MRSRASRVATIFGAVLAVAGWSLPAFAADAPSGAADKAAARATAVEAQLTAAQKQAVASFRAQFDKNQATVRTHTPATAGVRKASTGDQTLQVAVAKRNPDGTLAVSCVDDAAQFAEFLAEAKAPVKSEGKEQ